MQKFTGRQYLQIDIANNFGLDKKTWSERLAWFVEHQEHLLEMLPQAETPALFYAGIRAYETMLRGEPIGYGISLDATSSGLQLLAVLTGDRSAALLCNVVNQEEEHRADAYTLIYGDMLQQIGEEAKITRENCKDAVMKALYGSTAVPKRVFGEGPLLQIFLETMKRLAPAAWELNETFLEIWNPEALSNDWVLPDNFHVHVKVMTLASETVNFLNEPFEVFRKVNAPKKNGRSLGANSIHSIDGMIVREMSRRCDYDANWIELIKEILSGEIISHFATKAESKDSHRMVDILWKHFKESGYLSARILDYIDSDTIVFIDPVIISELINSLPAKPFKLMATHDCWRCLPQYGNDLRWQYNNQLYLIAKSNLLSFILSQILKHKVELGKLDETLPHDVLESDYALS
jgi:hypothetical protein